MRCQDVGPRDAEVLLVGEAPGAAEEREGRPFIGPAGQLLRQMLSHSGIDYNSCFVTNVMETRPPGNKFKYFYDGKLPTRELEDGWRRLQEKVEAVRPKVVIPLGAEPLKALCNKDGIGTWRGTWLSFRGINVLPTYHPSYVLRQYGDHVIVELDLKKAVSRKPAREPLIHLQPSIHHVLGWFDGLGSDYKRVSFDIETVGKHIRCLAIASKKSAICIPFIKFASSNLASPLPGDTIVKLSSTSGLAGSYWSPSEEVAVLDAISELFQSGVEVVGQNSICFDAPLIRDEFGLVIKNHYMDTMHAWHCLYPELPMGLSFLCSVLTDYPNYWTEKDVSNDMSEWRYNAMDSIVTLEVSEKIEKELKETEV